MRFGKTEKLEWCGYPVVKNFDDMFIHFDRIHERDGHTQTDRWTLHDDMPRLHSIALQKLNYFSLEGATKANNSVMVAVVENMRRDTNPVANLQLNLTVK